ncbi:ATP-binding protein [Roseomonas sp. GC11]|uniref:sensor histidine kinase n=1 Tax=Roseomonas sp. GC11 TaxID=2950546 RepID=UPI00210E2089|nr:ATP-binding protein [Roseomonas sp. GC11]MCQ4161367.1 ATP-binding protein [Roseomonas sp. GC11]
MTPRRHPSLARRLNLWLAAIYAGTLLAALLGFLLWARISGNVEYHHGLGSAGRAIAAAVAAGTDGPGLARLPAVRQFAARHGGGLAVWDGTSGRLLASHPPLPALPAGASPPQWLATLAAPYAEMQRIEAAGRPYLVGLAWDGRDFNAAASWAGDELMDEFLPVLLPMALLSLLAVPLLVRRALRPLHEAAHRPRDPAAPYPTAGLPRELLPFVTAANDALARMAALMERQRRFTADAAHALRTPLTALRIRLESLPPGPGTEALAATAERMSRLLQQLLDHARLGSGAPLPLAPGLDLAALARLACAEMEPIARQGFHRLALVEEGPLPPLRGHVATLAEAVEALLDNALQASPPGAEVEVALGPGPILEVRDRGPGLHPEDIPRLFEPFARGSGSTYPGSGLGLALVREAMQRHGGRIALLPRPGGGLIARLEFPPAPAETSSGNFPSVSMMR